MRNQRPMPRTPLLALALTLAAVPPLAAQNTQNESDPWPAFHKLPAAKQQAVATEFLATLPALPHTDRLRALAAFADTPPPPRAKARTAQRAKRTIEFPHEPDLLSHRIDYAFGLGTFELRHPNQKPTKATDPVVLQQALAGCAPDADKALAVLLHHLDTDTHGDDFAAFLHAWRNADESFYEALDRTAGTKDSVFFYDVMLGDFRAQFAKGEHKLAGGLQEAHDALHDAFLTYRQYRGFREAIAWSLVLPPDMPLPVRLRRYEEKVAGNYSLRQQITMVATVEDDLAGLIRQVAQEAPRLPQPIWAHGYDPYPPWTARFAAMVPKMIERAGSTDAFLEQAETARKAEAETLRTAAREHMLAALAAKAH
jgi:hypothetical protein